MKVLIDTNVVIDNLARRDEFGESLKIFRLCESGAINGIVTTATVMDVIYILRKHLPLADMRKAVQILIQVVDVVPVQKSDIRAALSSAFSDLEDAVQAFCATRSKADYIVTRNLDDFKNSTVPVISPIDFLGLPHFQFEVVV